MSQQTILCNNLSVVHNLQEEYTYSMPYPLAILIILMSRYRYAAAGLCNDNRTSMNEMLGTGRENWFCSLLCLATGRGAKAGIPSL